METKECQIIKCYHFVDAYTRKKLGLSQFCSTKVIIELRSPGCHYGCDAIINDYVQKLNKFKDAWSTRALAHLEITTYRFVGGVQHQGLPSL